MSETGRNDGTVAEDTIFSFVLASLFSSPAFRELSFANTPVFPHRTDTSFVCFLGLGLYRSSNTIDNMLTLAQQYKREF